MHAYRTHSCTALRASDVGQQVRLSGWIHRKRDHGNLLFIDLRDHYGLTQIVTDSDSPAFASLERLRVESVVTVTGTVVARSPETVNANLPTGEIEVRAAEVVIQSAAEELPMPVAGEQEYPEDIRLRYRFLDLRRERLHRNIMLRSQVIASLRRRMVEQGFTEFQTPILTASSPEGARDYLVPSRVHPGKFYALPQAPQMFKQLLMVAGFDRYFQIAPCFRDEDARADRSPGEFYQLDLEMSFVTQDDVFAALEPVLAGVFEEFSGGKHVTPAGTFPRIPYRESMLKYGSDKPDLRNPLVISDVTEHFVGSGFGLFDKIVGSMRAQGIGRGPLFIGRLAANANLVNGEGRVTASLAGRRGSNFELQTSAQIASDTVTLAGNGSYGNRRLRLVRPARLSKLDDSGWRLAPAVLRVGRGRLGLQGRFGGGLTDISAQFNTVPLALFDVAVRELGFGGNASGTLSYRQAEGGVPTGKASLKFDNLTRTGLIASSRPVDIAANLALTVDALAVRAVIAEQDKTVGRAQARIGNLPQGFDLFGRLRRGTLAGQLRFNGPADSLWRLLGIEAFDVTGQVGVAANLSGSLMDPSISGVLATRTARLESTLSGTVISDIAARGQFNGSRLTLTSFNGKAGSNGTVSGQGYVDYGGLFASPSRGVAVEIRAAAKNAQLVNRDDFGATVTGPLTISSDGTSGTLGGDVVLNRGRFRLGQFNAAEALPVINVREINRRADEAPRRVRPAVWRYDVKARAPNQFTVTGLGINSEWGANVTLTGTVDAPRITGQADLIRGEYEFAGRDFELVRGRINFRGESPPNPALDIAASANLSDLNATINVRGTGLAPEISFTSTPALPEDELLARLLFGSSITDISAPEAVQLAAALASLRGGGGLDPINALRGAIGLDRLRIVEGNQTLGQGTSIAAGKYITRNTYVEIVTDGRGYSATQVEFQITRWLSLLSSISTIGRQSANVRISRDY